jgi:UDP-N-acetylglucosamine acyltransferase
MNDRTNCKIHPTALVHPEARLSDGVEIGPYVIVEENVSIGSKTSIDAHAVIRGWTEIGSENKIGVGAVIGLEPQDLAYKNEKSFVKIGNKNNIREYVQIHRGTKEGTVTSVGDNNFILGFVHLAHNVKVGNNTIMANGALLAGYAEAEDFVFISGHCLVHQFCKIGKYAMMRGGSRVSLNIPPYCVADDANLLRGINTVGLERRGFTMEQIRRIKNTYKEVFLSGKPMVDTIKNILSTSPAPEIQPFLEFIQNSERGICRPEF